MIDAVALPLSSWESFYVIVGSSGAALTGLQFVMIALIADSQRRSSLAEINAFGTPTVVHFCTALIVAAILSAPWHTLAFVGILLGAIGVAGIGYVALVLRRARMQTGYKPVWEDWLWHAILPLAAYFAFTISGAVLSSHTAGALFTVGAMSLLLLLIGIHNAWDAATYIVVERNPKPPPDGSG
jgi:hypothetical protein